AVEVLAGVVVVLGDLVADPQQAVSLGHVEAALNRAALARARPEGDEAVDGRRGLRTRVRGLRRRGRGGRRGRRRGGRLAGGGGGGAGGWARLGGSVCSAVAAAVPTDRKVPPASSAALSESRWPSTKLARLADSATCRTKRIRKAPLWLVSVTVRRPASTAV